MPSARTLRHAFALALLALVSRALVPASFMPAATSNGGITFAMCSDGLAATGWLGADGKIHKQGEYPKDDGDADCAFSSSAAATIAAFEPAPAAPPPFVAIALLQSTTTSPGHGLAAPPPPATGPPILI